MLFGVRMRIFALMSLNNQLFYVVKIDVTVLNVG